jgi:para-aminobenzoate synthetase/4-amino-4-deoxychorismate lyase
MSSWRLDTDPHEHAGAVAHVQGLIAAGGVYQVNVTARAHATVRGDVFDLYRDLVHAQSASYNALLEIKGRTILSISPELFLDWSPPLLKCRPMKGTARRADASGDPNLLTSAKNIAENVMIVDLVRNDLGRIARTGTVRVSELGGRDAFGHVDQLSSTVECRPRDHTRLRDLVGAVFPSGSITGAPKHAAMATIEAVEPTPRGVYCGAIGWVAPPSSATRAIFNVAIRTLVIDDATGSAEYGTGGGITIDSEPAAEYQEMRDKLAVITTIQNDEPDLELLETFASERGSFRHLDRHLARLAASAAFFGIPYDETDTREALRRIVVGDRAERVRLRLRSNGEIAVQISATPTTSPSPVRLAIDIEPVASTSIWQHHKTNRRDVYSQARARHPQADDVVMINERSEITETTIANIAVRIDGTWYTPPLSSGCLPGVGRAVAIADGTLLEATLTPTDLERADAIAVINSLRGWRKGVRAH